MPQNDALLVFVKNLIQGKVKTRLSKDIGEENALDAYNKLLRYTRDITMKVDASKYVFYDTGIEDDDIWSAKRFRKQAQYGDTLGDRMYHAFQFALLVNKKAILIGSDCPTIKKRHVEEAIRKLDKHDIVIGPSEDGGYYLIGLKVNNRDLFMGVNWSTATVFEETVNKVNELGLKYYVLEELQDVDTVEEWNLYKDDLEERYPNFQVQLSYFNKK